MPAPAVLLTTLTAAGLGTTQSADIQNSSSKGIIVFINISALTGTGPTLTVNIQGKDPISGNYATLLASAVLNATGFTMLQVFPGTVAVANNVANLYLPQPFRIQYVVGGTGPAVTATISYALIGIGE